MSVVVFTGPTLSAADAAAELDARYVPPVAQGDVYRAALRRPQAIGIVDGYFERVPSVWHKEILWALSQGIHVFGAASMGALRAVELAPFGMRGVGWIYAAFQSGRLEADDEVAVTHGPEESGYRISSEALVNVRRTLERAENEGVVSDATRAAVVRAARELYYPDRAYPRVLAHAERAGAARSELDALRAWLPSGRIDQKRDDAIAMLREMRKTLRARRPPPPRFAVEPSSYFNALISEAGAWSALAPGTERLSSGLVIDELRLDAAAFRAAIDAALAMTYVLRPAVYRPLPPSADTLARVRARLVVGRGLAAEADRHDWLARHALTEAGFDLLVAEEAARVENAAQVLRRLPEAVLDHMRTSGDYERLSTRALEKERALAAHGLTAPRLEDARVTEAALLGDFARRLGRPRIEDPELLARELGLPDPRRLRRLLLRERCYERLLAGKRPAGEAAGDGRGASPSPGAGNGRAEGDRGERSSHGLRDRAW
jgi:hypothetical protein